MRSLHFSVPCHREWCRYTSDSDLIVAFRPMRVSSPVCLNECLGDSPLFKDHCWQEALYITYTWSHRKQGRSRRKWRVILSSSSGLFLKLSFTCIWKARWNRKCSLAWLGEMGLPCGGPLKMLSVPLINSQTLRTFLRSISKVAEFS